MLWGWPNDLLEKIVGQIKALNCRRDSRDEEEY